MIDERREEQACLHAVGALPPAEAADFERELARDPELRAFVARLRDTTAALVAALPQCGPAPELKARVLAALPEPEAAPRARRVAERAAWWRWDRFFWGIAGAAATVAALLAFQNHSLRSGADRLARQAAQAAEERGRLAAANQRLGQELADAQQRSSQLFTEATSAQGELQAAREQHRAEAAELRTAVAELKAQDHVSQLRIALLGSLLDDSPATSAVSVWDARQQEGILLARGLAPLPADKDYQLWVIDPATKAPIDGGVFRVQPDGTVRFRFQPRLKVTKADKFAITRERKGGVPQPEGTMVLLGG